MRLAAVVIVGLVCSAALAAEPVQRSLSFEERVKAQTAIERVYYSHQVGATKSFEAAVPKAVIEAKVRKYLEQSAALNLYWKTPVTDYSLQRELERMAQGTRMPERLQELYAALGNNAFLVKECLARATLVDRLTRNFYAFDATMHVTARTQAEHLHQQLVSGELSASTDHPSRSISVLLSGTANDQPQLDSQPVQERLTADQLKTRRAELPETVGQVSDVNETRDVFTVSVILSETATELHIANYVVPKVAWEAWWVTAHTTAPVNSVTPVAAESAELPVPRHDRSLNPNTSCADDLWDNGSLEGPPTPRIAHTAVWTGSQMLVWGGYFAGYTLDTGSRYDPATDSWTSISTIGAPTPRVQHSAVWTGNVMVVWGGSSEIQAYHYVNTGGRYDPVADMWTPTTKIAAPWPRYVHSAVWTGSRMVVWGGFGGSFGGDSTTYSLNTGAQYDPATDRWTATSTSGAPSPRGRHTAVWTGSSMIVWGGNGYQNSGGRYDPSSDTWTPTSQADAPTGRQWHSAVWTGTRMIVWGGDSYRFGDECYYDPYGGGICFEPVNTGGIYDPATDAWTPTSTDGAPPARNFPAAVWTGNLMVVMGNSHAGPGGRYDLATDSWSATSSIGAPLDRERASVVWTGSLVVVWGGYDYSLTIPPPYGYTDTGARYDPTTDSWTPTGVASGPIPRGAHTAVWTGSQMLVWGGYLNPQYPDAGGRYDPTIDSWTLMSTLGVPSSRFGHVALWTGSSMVVWGGEFYDGQHHPLDTGGRYDPANDSWAPVSTTGAPSARASHTAVWTGSRMVIWGGTDYDSESPFLDTGGRYDPVGDSWVPTSTAGAPSRRIRHTAVWTGSRMLVWGGYADDNGLHNVNTGGRYDPSTDSWAPTSTIDAPTARRDLTTVWSGDLMIVWGGDAYSNTGGRYDPDGDVWTPTSTTGAPFPRTDAPAVWTGNQMIIWSGSFGGFDPRSGGRYDPVTDRWTAIATRGAPPVSSLQTAVWTGTLMVVWGDGGGGRYSPGTVWPDDCDADGFAESAGDCDDHDAAVYPGAPQICDGVNNDCSSPNWPYFPHADDQETDRDNDGFLSCGDDCDDSQPTVYPGAPQMCDGLDNDCHDPNWPNPPADEADADHDYFRICDGDCNDTDGRIGPGFWEYCDGLDNGCDNEVDEGAAVNCEDYDPCTDDVCAGAAGCTNPYNSSPCEDNNDCTSDDVCSNGYCQGTPTSGNACNDYDVCTLGEMCVEGACTGGTPVQCDDGDPCDGVEYCYPYYGCYSYNPLNCNDNQPCTDDSCDPATGCVHTPNNDNDCSDSNACTNGDRCVDGACQSGTTVVCNDSNPCTTDSCSPYSGCVFSNNNNACDDGNACTVGDYCAFGHCFGGQNANCDDNNPCTVDSCNEAGTCVHVVLTGSCDDGNFCTLADTCVDGVCVGGTLIDCNDDNVCTRDRCDPNQGCVSEFDENHCNDHDQCTDDICDPSSGDCTFVNNTLDCEDGNACTSGDTCGGGACHPGSPTVCNDGTVCTTDSCDPLTGCLFTGNTNACDDGNACTTNDVCAPHSGAGIFTENFDGVTAPALPAGWVSMATGPAGSPWVTRTAGSDTAPNTAFVSDVNRPAEVFLESPAIPILSSEAKLTFRNRWSYEDTDTCWDGGVLEIKIGAGSFADILYAGGSFVSGGYTGTIEYFSRNPLASRAAWCNLSPGYPAFITTTVKLPAAAAGNPVRLRWRMGSDSALAAVGQDIDSIEVTDPANTCSPGPALDCNDNDPCTDDSCNPSTGCVHSTGASECDDGNQCTDDLCSPSTGCSHVTRTGSCNDGDPCTIGDICTAGTCGGAPNSCNDGDPCTADSCAPGLGCRHESFDGPCDDGNVCTSHDACSGGICDGTPLSGGACNDFNACTADGTCFEGGCYPGPAIVCDDSNACTTDSCDPATGCRFTNNTNACDDGSVCTIGDRCGGGGCVPGQAINCSDGNICTSDSCDPVTGCAFADNTIACDDGNACTAGDVCGGGDCQSGAAVVCDDNNVCTTNSCDPVTGCFFTANSGACDDGNACTTHDSCGPPSGGYFFVETFDGVTSPALPPGWTTSVSGTGHAWVTQGASGESAPNLLSGIESDHVSDSVLVSPAFAITSTAAMLTFRNRWQFDDVNGCYDASVLEIKIGAGGFDDIVAAGGTFVGGGYTGTVALEYGNPLAGHAAWCHTSAGYPAFLTTAVKLPEAAAGQTIQLRWRLGSDSSIAYTGQDIDSIEVRDQAIGCNGGPARDCDDENPCTDDSCDPATGCIHTNNTAACDDGSVCTEGDTCGGGLCLGAAVNCDDDNPCTIDVCDPLYGCYGSPASSSTRCDDGNVCNGVEFCDGYYGECRSYSPPQCDDGSVCTTDSCDPATGCRHANNANACNDGNGCTQIDLCVNGACVGSNPVVCSPADQCHTGGTCDPVTGACSNTPAPDGTACNDNNVCTTGETCRAGTCTAATSGLNEANPRTNGYYKSLCHGPHSGDALTDADAVCVSTVAHTFAGISTVADLCAELQPSQPNSDACDRTDDDLMVLALNICRARVCTAQSIDSECGGNANVGQSLAESDAILGSSSRTAATCARAKCLLEEINTGTALELDTLTLTREKSGIRLRWNPPYLNDGTGHPSWYHVWRRALGSILPFRTIAETTETTFLDVTTGGETFQYEITAVMQ